MDAAPITANFLSALGYTQAEAVALPSGIKDCATWLMTTRGLDQDRLNNAVNGINANLATRDFHGFIGENVDKWLTDEPTKGGYNWTNDDLLASQVASLAPTLTTRTFHLVVGQNIYQPTWTASELGSTPGNILSLLDSRADAIKAKFPNDNAFLPH